MKEQLYGAVKNVLIYIFIIALTVSSISYIKQPTVDFITHKIYLYILRPSEFLNEQNSNKEVLTQVNEAHQSIQKFITLLYIKSFLTLILPIFFAISLLLAALLLSPIPFLATVSSSVPVIQISSYEQLIIMLIPYSIMIACYILLYKIKIIPRLDYLIKEKKFKFFVWTTCAISGLTFAKLIIDYTDFLFHSFIRGIVLIIMIIICLTLALFSNSKSTIIILYTSALLMLFLSPTYFNRYNFVQYLPLIIFLLLIIAVLYFIGLRSIQHDLQEKQTWAYHRIGSFIIFFLFIFFLGSFFVLSRLGIIPA